MDGIDMLYFIAYCMSGGPPLCPNRKIAAHPIKIITSLNYLSHQKNLMKRIEYKKPFL